MGRKVKINWNDNKNSKNNNNDDGDNYKELLSKLNDQTPHSIADSLTMHDNVFHYHFFCKT